MDTLISELIALVQQTAPELWRIAMRQVMTKVISDAVLLVVFALIVIGGLITIKKVRAWRRSDDFDKYDEGDASEIILSIAIVGAISATIGFLVTAFILIGYVVNPEYYAIQVLLDLVQR